MSHWPKYPLISEINTWVWLDELSRRQGERVTLATVPPEVWDELAGWGFDALWLMGVWERSPAGRRVALDHPGLQQDYRRALADFRPEDVAGSPYCVHRYVVDPALGGTEGLAAARQRLAERGLRLILDFVPNHVAVDHPWTTQHPEFFIPGDDSGDSFTAAGRRLAHGRDPHFPAWTDTAQLNVFHPGLRAAAIEVLQRVAGLSDGVRCDMAMLVLNRVFQWTWGERAGPVPGVDFWEEVIPAVTGVHHDFLFIAEAYWDLEWTLQQQGFRYCYDKRLYDRLLHDNAESVRLHLCAHPGYQNRLIRFLENHDEPRAAAVFAPARRKAAALTALANPGARLLHQGQIEGARIKLPVQLGRRPQEAEDPECREFYRRLLAAISKPPFRDGHWRLLEASGWPDNSSCRNLVAWWWHDGSRRFLVVVNLSDTPSQARVRLPWEDLGSGSWRLDDPITGDAYRRDGDEMLDPGLFVGLPPWGAHFFELKPASGESAAH